MSSLDMGQHGQQDWEYEKNSGYRTSPMKARLFGTQESMATL